MPKGQWIKSHTRRIKDPKTGQTRVVHVKRHFREEGYTYHTTPSGASYRRRNKDVESFVAKLNRPRRNRVNKGISRLISNKYFNHVPMDEIEEILMKDGYSIPSEGYILTGHKGKASWRVFDSLANKYTNSYLHVSWYRMPSGSI